VRVYKIFSCIPVKKISVIKLSIGSVMIILAESC
jgi:hypothetical protein